MARTALAQPPLPLIHVLLVEDNPSDAFYVESLLEDGRTAEYKILCVRTQLGAIAALAEQVFDVCLLDLRLPDATGFSALIDIQEKAPGMPVLILSGMNDMQLAKLAVGRGAQDYLLKDEIGITGVCRFIDYAMERKRLEKDLFQRANCDTLTELSNREAFLTRLNIALARAGRSGLGIAVLFIDLDNFKPVNDMHGHEAGDEVLRALAARIKSVVRAYDTPARLGGDEFAVLVENIYAPRDAANIAQKLVKSLSAPVAYQRHALEVSVSIGIAFSDAQTTADLLLSQADTAMYHVKKDGGDAYRFFAESMQEEALTRLTLEEDLCTAMIAKQLRLYYQPYVSPDGDVVMGVEALLRWEHPERGLLSAYEFLPAAEGARLMLEIGKWKCAQLERDIALLNQRLLLPLTIAVNLSVSQLETREMQQWIARITDKQFLGLHQLAIEIHEEALVKISGARFMALARLHEMDVLLHLDHFGCNVLPLTTLCSIPFSLLKLDMSLIRHMTRDVSENILVSAAIMLAHHLGIKAGAVGIEEPWQAATLKAHACDTMQGHYTTAPMTADHLAEWLDKRHRMEPA